MKKFILTSIVAAIFGMTNIYASSDDMLSFAVISDVHHGKTVGENSKVKVPRALKNITSYKELDAIFTVGDLTDNGKSTEYDELISIWSNTENFTNPVGQKVFMMGNHDNRDANAQANYSNALKGYNQGEAYPLDQYLVIKGYPFITISQRNSANNDISNAANGTEAYPEEVCNKLDQWLAQAVAECPGKPIFVFTHVAPRNTCYSSWPTVEGTPWSMNVLNPILNKYPQAVVFAGHSHYPIGDPRSIHQGANPNSESKNYYTVINTGSVAYSEVQDNAVNEGIHPTGYATVTEGMILTEQPNGDIEIRRYDTYRNEEIDPEHRWVLKAPFDGSMFEYADKRDANDNPDGKVLRDGLPAPYFVEASEASVKVSTNSAVVTFPQATDETCVFRYRVRALKNGTPVKEKYVFSQFYLNSKQPEELSATIDGLDKDTEYTFEVRAYDSYDNVSAPIIGTATTESDKVPACTGLWTFEDKDNLLACSEGTAMLQAGICGSKTVTLKENAASANITQVDGPSSGNKAVHVPATSIFKLATNEGASTNEYTIQMDLKVASLAKFNSLLQINLNNNDDGDMFINSSGEIGVKGIYSGTVTTNTWHRIVLVNDNSHIYIYLDGNKLGDKSDTRWDLTSNGMLLFADENGEVLDIEVAEIAYWDCPLSISQINNIDNGATSRYIELNTKDIKVSNDNPEFSINIKSSVLPQFEIPEWIEAIDATPVVGEKAYSFKVAPMAEFGTRKGTIIIKGDGVNAQNINVIQENVEKNFLLLNNRIIPSDLQNGDCIVFEAASTSANYGYFVKEINGTYKWTEGFENSAVWQVIETGNNITKNGKTGKAYYLKNAITGNYLMSGKKLTLSPKLSDATEFVFFDKAHAPYNYGDYSSQTTYPRGWDDNSWTIYDVVDYWWRNDGAQKNNGTLNGSGTHNYMWNVRKAVLSTKEMDQLSNLVARYKQIDYTKYSDNDALKSLKELLDQADYCLENVTSDNTIYVNLIAQLKSQFKKISIKTFNKGEQLTSNQIMPGDLIIIEAASTTKVYDYYLTEQTDNLGLNHRNSLTFAKGFNQKDVWEVIAGDNNKILLRNFLSGLYISNQSFGYLTTDVSSSYSFSLMNPQEAGATTYSDTKSNPTGWDENSVVFKINKDYWLGNDVGQQSGGMIYFNGTHHMCWNVYRAAEVPAISNVTADVLDVVFNDDGTASDLSALNNLVEKAGGKNIIKYSKIFEHNIAEISAEYGGAPVNYFKIAYDKNNQFLEALKNGHSIETVFCLREGDIADAEAKMFSSHQSGGTGLMICKTGNGLNKKNEITFLPNVNTTTSSSWKWTPSGITPESNVYYHVVGVWDKEQGKSRIYINGELKNEVNAVGNFVPSSQLWFCIGGDPYDATTAETSANWNIAVSRIYDNPLTEQEVSFLWKQEKDGIDLASAFGRLEAFVATFESDGNDYSSSSDEKIIEFANTLKAAKQLLAMEDIQDVETYIVAYNNIKTAYDEISFAKEAKYFNDLAVKAGSYVEIKVTGLKDGDKICLSSETSDCKYMLPLFVTETTARYIIPEGFVGGSYKMSFIRDGLSYMPFGKIQLDMVERLPIGSRVIAHRGFHEDNSASPHNSRASLRKALARGFAGSETDVWLTKDKHIIINHDKSYGGKIFQDYNIADYSANHLANGEPLPELKDFLQIMKEEFPDAPTKLQIEIKDDTECTNTMELCQAVVDEVKAANMDNRVSYISFNLPVCKKILEISPKAEVAYLSYNTNHLKPVDLLEQGDMSYDYDHTVIKAHPEYITQAEELGMSSIIFTVNLESQLLAYNKMDVDFIATDQPAIAQEIFEYYQENTRLTTSIDNGVAVVDFTGKITPEMYKDVISSEMSNCLSIDLSHAILTRDLTYDVLTSVTSNANTLYYLPSHTRLASEPNIVVDEHCQNLILTDKVPFATSKEITVTTATYTRTLPDGEGWNSAVLPYDFDVTADMEVINNAVINGSSISFSEVAIGETIPANTPFLYRKVGGGTITIENVDVEIAPLETTPTSGALLGTYVKIPAGEATGKLIMTQDGMGFATASALASIPAFRAYLNGGASSQVFTIVVGDEVTGMISADANVNEKVDVYTLDGKLIRTQVEAITALQGLENGTYIINGNKIKK